MLHQEIPWLDTLCRIFLSINMNPRGWINLVGHLFFSAMRLKYSFNTFFVPTTLAFMNFSQAYAAVFSAFSCWDMIWCLGIKYRFKSTSSTLFLTPTQSQQSCCVVCLKPFLPDVMMKSQPCIWLAWEYCLTKWRLSTQPCDAEWTWGWYA